MKLIKKTYKWLLTLGMLVTLGSCSLFDLDINKDPNNPSTADFALLLPSAQLSAVGFFQGLNNNAHGFTGWLSSSDTYDLNFNSYNGSWNNFYSGPMKDVEEIIVTATTAGNNPYYLGVAQVMKAYFFSIMVDMFGEIPYSQAFAGGYTDSNINPAFDDDKAIYDDLIKLCDDAVVNLTKSSAVTVSGDLFYSGNITRWRKLAKTVKLRLLINSRLVRSTAATEIKAILDGGDYISAAADDFQFKYNRVATPDGRHPWFSTTYANSDNGFTYFLHQPMFEMLRDDDPRLPFYFKRQTSYVLNPNDPTDRSTIPCSQLAGCTYAYMALNDNIIKQLYTDKGKTFTTADRQYLAGFFGRDRGDASGVPLDGFYRLAPGTYPAAGAYDVATASRTGATAASRAGDGIAPLITSWMTKYYQIEAILTLGIAGDARTIFDKAMREQITKVVALGLASDANAKAPTTAAIDDFVNLNLKRYDDAPNATQKLNIVLKQAFYANLGNGFEIYNAFRRTGLPNNLQVPIQQIRNFPLRLPQPAQETSLNKSAPQSPVAFDTPAAAIFWDTMKFSYPR